MLADVQMKYGISSVHVQWFSHGKVEQMIMTSSNGVTVISHAIRGEVCKESELEPRGCHLGFWHQMVGSSVKLLTLYSGYISASHGARVYPG